VPPVILTVAPDRLTSSGSLTETDPDKVAGAPSSVKAAVVATFDNVGASLMLVMLTVLVTAVLRLNEPEPSLSTQVTVRVGFEPELAGFSGPAVNVTVSSTVW
jgi:hypothetical protein